MKVAKCGNFINLIICSSQYCVPDFSDTIWYHVTVYIFNDYANTILQVRSVWEQIDGQTLVRALNST